MCVVWTLMFYLSNAVLSCVSFEVIYRTVSRYVTMDHKTSHKGQFYTSSESWINKPSIYGESSFKYLGVNISEDLTWTTHIQTQVKKARQRLYHLRQLRKFRVSPAILKTFYSGTIESVLTQCISVWYGNSSSQDCKALQRVVRLADHISGSALPSL